MEEFKIGLIANEDEQAVLVHLKNNFCKDEPILNYVKLQNPTECDELFLDVIRDGVSLKATDKDGKIVGVYLNRLVEKNKPLEPHKLNSASSPQFQKLCAILDYTETIVNIFDLYPKINAYIDGHILSVDSGYRGKGLAKKLTEGLFDLAKAKKVNLIYVFCSSLFTYKICSKFGFKKIAEKPYRDMDIGSIPPISMPEPHTTTYFVVKEL